MKKSEESLCDLWDTIKRSNLCIIGVPEEERNKGRESLFKEVMAENFPNLGRDLDLWVHEAHRSSWNFHPKWYSMRHIIIKLSKIKDEERIFEAARAKNSSHTRQPSWSYQWISQQKPCTLGQSGMIYSKCWKKKSAKQDYFTQHMER